MCSYVSAWLYAVNWQLLQQMHCPLNQMLKGIAHICPEGTPILVPGYLHTVGLGKPTVGPKAGQEPVFYVYGGISNDVISTDDIKVID